MLFEITEEVIGVGYALVVYACYDVTTKDDCRAKNGFLNVAALQSVLGRDAFDEEAIGCGGSHGLGYLIVHVSSICVYRWVLAVGA